MNNAIRHQLFGTAPLVGSPRLLVYATVEPKGSHPALLVVCIDYTKYKSFAAWEDDGKPSSAVFPSDYQDLDYKPFASQGKNDLAQDNTHADFRAVALAFHNEFFGEHADNTIFVNLVKCLLAKIHDERTCKKGEKYEFQIFYKNGRPESAREVFARVNELYKAAYKRYIDPGAAEIDEVNPKEFSEANVKTVVQALQAISITKGAAKHGDIIGTFFEEILRAGFKQDRGMYFTHDNLVHFMVEAIDLGGLTHKIWKASDHPENRLPYVIDPACGSGTFLLHAMNVVTATIKKSAADLVTDHDSEQFYKARLSDDQPNYWAEAFIYGFDPKFIMAITAKVNMVLHGDGSAHIFKNDAYLPLARYSDVRLRPTGDSQRSVSRASYKPDVCESFDVVISNPPFGITLSADVRAKISTTFSIPGSAPSEGLFIERCFQLLRPGGRLAVVLPESVLNAKEMSDVRRFLYRFFNLRAIVSLPRNIFIDTPTLTSLVFAQKKTSLQIQKWDDAWATATTILERKTKQASAFLRAAFATNNTAIAVAKGFAAAMTPVISQDDWVSKGGKSSSVLSLGRTWKVNETGEEAAEYYREVIKTAGYRDLCHSFLFSEVARVLDSEFPVFVVDEVGYKLSKRREKARPNQLSLYKGAKSGKVITNLHLAEEEYSLVMNLKSPQTALDAIRKSVVWS